VSGALVAKLGGNALALLPDALAAADGRPLILVHGGGAQITALMAQRGIPARFVDGRRFTDLPTLACARVALADVSDELVAALRAVGREANSCSARVVSSLVSLVSQQQLLPTRFGRRGVPTGFR
jgi:acetylglutamate kinase